MPSLQEQLLQAGLIDKKKAKQVKKSKQKAQTAALKSKQVSEDETKLAAKKQRQQKAAQDKALNQAKQAAADAKAILAQAKQMVETHQLKQIEGEVKFNFVDGNKIKTRYLKPLIVEHLSQGFLAIAKIDHPNEPIYAVIPKKAAEKIQQRASEMILHLNAPSDQQPDEEDPYAEFEIPDDLMW